jgi:hypothetical protein
MRASEFVPEAKPSAKVCKSAKTLGASWEASCKARGLRKRTSKGKGHADGSGKTPGRYVKGKYVKSVQYGGPVRDYS